MNGPVLFEARGVPATLNRTYETREEAVACARGDLELVQDLATGLVRNALFDPARVGYDARYRNEQATSPTFRRHLDGVRGIVGRTMGGRRLVEVGCGKGFFLESLRADGFDAEGLDPAYEGDAPWVRRASFTGQPLEAEAVVLRHVLEHVAEPWAFLADLARATPNGARIYVEVPCFAWILSCRAWFDCCYEHANYFRLEDFEGAFGSVLDSGRLFGGQYLYVVAELASLRTPRVPSPAVSVPDGFLASMPGRADWRAPEGPFAIWGASAKGTMYAHYLAAAGAEPARVVDIDPAKQGRYLAGSGLRVSAPEEALAALPSGASIHVMNANYRDEIAAIGGPAFRYLPMPSAGGSTVSSP